MGECKFRKELFDNAELRKLRAKIKFSEEMYYYYYLFSMSGFTDAVIEKSKTDKNLFLVDIGKIINDVV